MVGSIPTVTTNYGVRGAVAAHRNVTPRVVGSIPTEHPIFADIAQSVEQQAFNLKVRRSIRRVRTNTYLKSRSTPCSPMFSS